MAYDSQNFLEIYRQWVSNGRKISFKKIIEIASRLVCNGLNRSEIV